MKASALFMVRHVTERAADQDKERAIGDSVVILKRTVSCRLKAKTPITRIAKLLKDNDLSLIESDKEGRFAVLPKALLQQKAETIMEKSFNLTSFEPQQQKKLALELLKNLKLGIIRKRVGKAGKSFLEAFSKIKTHKPDCPLRVIVFGEGVLQREVSKYLQRHLSFLSNNDPKWCTVRQKL